MNKLLEQLKTIPAFNALEAAVKEKLTEDSAYVQDFMPETEGFCEEDDDFGNVSGHYYKMSDDESEEEGIEGLLSDNSGVFDEFVTEVIRDEAVEMIRALIKEIMK